MGPARLLHPSLPVDSKALSVGTDAIYVVCSSATVLRVSCKDGRAGPCRVRCAGGNVVADDKDVFVLDVRDRTIRRERDATVVEIVTGLPLSGVGALDREHLFFTTTELLCRVDRTGTGGRTIVTADEPAILGIHDGTLAFTVGSFFAPATQVFVIPTTEGPPREIDVGNIMPGCVRLAGDAILTLDAARVLASYKLDGGPRVELARLADWPEYQPIAARRPFLIADSTHVYFEGADTLHRWRLSGGAVETAAIRKIRHHAWGEHGFFWLSEAEGRVELHGW